MIKLHEGKWLQLRLSSKAYSSSVQNIAHYLSHNNNQWIKIWKNGWHHRLLLCNLTLTHAIQNNIQLWLKYNLDIRVYQVCAMHAFRRDDAHVETGLESCRCWMHPHCAWKNHLLHWFVNCLLFIDKFQILTYKFKQLL